MYGYRRWRVAEGDGLQPETGYIGWMTIAGELQQVTGYTKWLVTAGRGLRQVTVYSKWLVMAGGGLRQVTRYSKWRVTAGGVWSFTASDELTAYSRWRNTESLLVVGEGLQQVTASTYVWKGDANKKKEYKTMSSKETALLSTLTLFKRAV